MPIDHGLFIYRYMDRSTPRGDSQRFRIRIRAAFPDEAGLQNAVWSALRSEAGITPPSSSWGTLWESFFTESPMEEVLTSITLTFRVLREQRGSQRAIEFLKAVERALAEEHLGFRVDSNGVIHYAVDEVFEGMRAATLASLDAPVLAVARRAYEDAFRHLDQHPPDTKACIRSTFETLEILAKQLEPTAKNLNAYYCRNQLRAKFLTGAGYDPVEERVWTQLMEGMAEWVDSIHQYRHGQVDALGQPSEQLAVYVLSSGSAYVRLLAGLALRIGVEASAE